MKFLLLNGSPRKGNTWKLAELAKAQIAAADTGSEFREVHLADAKLPFCAGCSNCFRKGSEFCPHRDVMDKLLADMDWADGVIVAASTFNMSPPALLRNLMDHLCYLLHRPRFFTKKALVITTTGGIGAGKAAKVVGSLLTGIGFNRVFRLPVMTRSWNCFAPGERILRKADQVTLRFFRDTVTKKLRPPALPTLIPYNLFRGMCPSQTGSIYPTVDADHWSDPVRARRCYDSAVPVRWYHRAFGSMFYGMGKVMGGKVKVSYRKDG